jgi:uracil-DNA glycosylase family 4
MNEIDTMKNLYKDIFNCNRCPKVVRDRQKEVSRNVDPEKILSKMAMMAQAPSETGVRLSGYHWIRKDGTLLPGAGPFLENYLNIIGFSVVPSKPYKKPYTTNALHCWTGPGKNGDRKPSNNELKNCKKWWLEELKIVNPQIVILLGKQPRRAFDIVTGNKIQKMINLGIQGEEIQIEDYGLNFKCFVVPHPSWRDYWKKKDEYDKVFKDIKHYLISIGWALPTI